MSSPLKNRTPPTKELKKNICNVQRVRCLEALGTLCMGYFWTVPILSQSGGWDGGGEHNS